MTIQLLGEHQSIDHEVAIGAKSALPESRVILDAQALGRGAASRRGRAFGWIAE